MFTKGADALVLGVTTEKIKGYMYMLVLWEMQSPNKSS